MKLMDQVHEAMRVRHLSRHTEEAYVQWMLRFLRFHSPGATWRGRGWPRCEWVRVGVTHWDCPAHVETITPAIRSVTRFPVMCLIAGCHLAWPLMAAK